MQILLILLSSGSLGFVSYLIMRELSILSFPLREKEIEKITLIHFSIFNAIAAYSLYWFIFEVDLLTVQLDIHVFIKLIGISLATSVFMPAIYAVVLKAAQITFGAIQRKRNLITTKFNPLFDDLFLPKQYEDTYVIVFDYSNKFIHSGHLDRMEYKEGKLYFSLHPSPYYQEYSYDDVLKMFHYENRDPDKLRIVIDSDRQQKYFLMYNPSEDNPEIPEIV